MIKREFLQKHEKLDFKFYQNVDDFIVEEVPIKFAGRGNFIIAKIKKTKLGTWDLLESLSKGLQIYENELQISIQISLFNFKYSWTDLPLNLRDTFYI